MFRFRNVAQRCLSQARAFDGSKYDPQGIGAAVGLLATTAALTSYYSDKVN